MAVTVREKYGVRLTPEQRDQFQHLIRSGKTSARLGARVRVLLKTDEGWPAPLVAEALDVSVGTGFRIKRRFAEAGLEGVPRDRPQAHRYRKLDDRGEAHIIALTCSPVPEGHDPVPAGWQGSGVGVSLVHVPREGAPASQKTPSSRGRRRSGASPR